LFVFQVDDKNSGSIRNGSGMQSARNFTLGDDYGANKPDE